MCTRGRPSSSFPVEVRGFFACSNNASLPFTVTKHASEQTQLHCYEGVEATSNRKTQARTRSQSTLRSRRDVEEKEMNKKKKENLGSVAKLDAHKTRRASRCHLYPFFPPLILSLSPLQFERVKGLAVHSLFVLVFLLPLLADPAFTFFFLLLHRVCVCVCMCFSAKKTHTAVSFSTKRRRAPHRVDGVLTSSLLERESTDFAPQKGFNLRWMSWMSSTAPPLVFSKSRTSCTTAFSFALKKSATSSTRLTWHSPFTN